MLRWGKKIGPTLFRDRLYLHLLRNRGGCMFMRRSKCLLAADLGVHRVFISIRGVAFLRGGLLSA